MERKKEKVEMIQGKKIQTIFGQNKTFEI